MKIMIIGGRLKISGIKILVNNNMKDGRGWWVLRYFRIFISFCWRIEVFISFIVC